MALRRITVSLLFLAAFAGAALLLWQTQAPSQHGGETLRPQAFPVSSFDFSYASQSYLNPALPNGKAQASGFTIACESKGLVHLSAQSQGDLTLIFEFTDVLCGEANVMAERGLARTVQYSREFLASPLAVERATEDPALAIARSVFLHMDGGLRARWPETHQVLLNREERLEGEVTPEMHLAWQNGAVQWTKKFVGPVMGGASSAGLTQSLRYEVEATSHPAQPIELGLLRLQGSEQSVSLQKKNLVARTDIQITLRRRAPLTQNALQTMLADTQANASAAAPRILTAEEKEQIISRWDHFRDGEGQKPALGSSEANQDTYLELKHALRQDPTLASELADELREIDPDSSAFATLAGAMIYSGESEALDAFVEQALAHKDDGHWQERALPMVGLAPAPTGASWKYLDTMRQQPKHPDVATAAELGMATHLKHGFQDPVFVDELQLRLEKAQTETERLHLLDVVGNAGLEQFFPIISAWLKGASLPLRMRIVQALRFMKRPEAETILLAMAAAPEADLALTALQCLRDRTMAKESIPVLLKLLGQTQDDRIRLKVLENLYEARSLDAGLLPNIQNLRRSMAMGQALAEAWEQMEKDWVDPVES